MKNRSLPQILVVLLMVTMVHAAQEGNESPSETRILSRKLGVLWDLENNRTRISKHLVFILGSQKDYTDLRYADSFYGKKSFNKRECYYQIPGEEKQKLPKDWLKISDAFEDYILYSDRHVAEWTLNNLPIGTQVELEYDIEIDRLLDFLKIPLQHSWSIDTTEITFRFSSQSELAIHLLNIDSLDLFETDTSLAIGEIAKWESKPFDGGFEVAASWVFCKINDDRISYSNWSEVAAEVQDWWRRVKLKLPGKKKMGETDLQMISSLPHNTSAFEDAFRYVAIYVGDHGYIPHHPKDVFKFKYGDCKDLSLTFCELSKLNGFNPVPVLVNVPARSPFFEGEPSPYQFNHCIAAYIEDQDTVYYDPTTKGYSIGKLPWVLQEAYALWLSPETEDILKLPSDRNPVLISRKVKGELLPDGNFTGNIEVTYDQRLPLKALLDGNEKEIEKIIRGNISDDLSVEIDSVECDLRGGMLSGRLTVNRLSKNVGKKSYLSPSLFYHNKPDFSLGVSSEGFYLGRPRVYLDSLIMTLPTHLQETVEIADELSNEFMISRLRVEANENRIIGEWESGFLMDNVPIDVKEILTESVNRLSEHRNKRVSLYWKDQ